MLKKQMGLFSFLKWAFTISGALSLIYLLPSFFSVLFGLLIFIIFVIRITNYSKIVICLSFALLCFLCFILLRNYTQKIHYWEGSDQVLVCVAKSDIPENTLINTSHIAYRPMPLKYKPEKALFWKDRADLLGLLIKTEIKARDYFLSNMFRKPTPEEEKRYIKSLEEKWFNKNSKLFQSIVIPIYGRDFSEDAVGNRVEIFASFGSNFSWSDCHSIFSNILLLALKQKFLGEGKLKIPYRQAIFCLNPLECELLIKLFKTKTVKFQLKLYENEGSKSETIGSISKKNLEQIIQKAIEKSE